MLKLLIADDETLSLNYLSQLFQWENYNIELVGSYTDGYQVIDHLSAQPVDIIITDIRMPFCDGLELTKYCYTHYPDTSIILITAYREFEYAQTAINYGVKSLITKPFTKECMEKALIGIIKDKISDANTNNFSSHSKYQSLFSDILCGTPDSFNAITQLSEEFDFANKQIELFKIEFSNFDDFMENSWKYGETRFYNAISMIAFSKTDSFCSSMVQIEKNVLSLIIACYNPSEAEKHISNFMVSLNSVFGIKSQIESHIHFDTLAELTNASIAKNFSIFSKNTFLKNVQQFIEDNYAKDITLEDVARTLCISKAYFCSLYKKYTDETFFTTLKKVRLQKAKELLITTSFKTSAIHELVGYKSNPYFYDAFKEYYDMTPHEFRQKYRRSD